MGQEGQPEVVLAAITHPHLDHVNGAGTMLRKILQERKLKKVLWWGGHTLRRTRKVYLHAKKYAQGVEPRGAAQMTTDFLDELVGFQDARTVGTIAPEIDEGYELSLAYSGETSDGPIKFHVISPWEGPQTEYTQWVDAKVRAEPRKGVANATSMGFLIEYGSAQILLGGDAENPNWDECWKALTTDEEHKNKLPPLVPCLIKVSHHGSKTGCIPGMWESGFFRSIEKGGPPPVCVITPWRNGGHRLPKPDMIEKISEAGCHVWETAALGETSGIDDATNPLSSFIHLRVDATTNKANLENHRFCQYTPPD